jgi:hypothetical protein
MNHTRFRALGTLALAAALCVTAACDAPQQQDTAPPEDTAPPIPAWDELAPVTLPQGTVLRCAVAEDLDLRRAHAGTVVTLIATERLVLDGVEIILPGTHLQARVEHVAQSLGGVKAATLTLDLVSIEATSGSVQDCAARPIRVQLAAGSPGLSAGTLLDVFLSAPVDMPLPQGI